MDLWSSLMNRMREAVKHPLAGWAIGGAVAVLIAGFLALLYERAPVALDEGGEKITFIRIGAGASDSPYFGLGRRLAAIISRPPDAGPCEPASPCGVEGLVAVVKSSAGSVANVRAVSAGHFESALVRSTTLVEAWRASGPFGGERRLANLRAIAGIRREAVHLVASRGANIRSMADLAGKRVSLGGKGSGTADVALAILRGYGLTAKNVELFREDPERASDMMLHGQLDAFFLIAAVPDPLVADLAARGTIDLVPIDGEATARLIESHGELSAAHIEGEAYRFMPALDTLALGAVWICNANADSAVVHDMTKALFEPGNREFLPAADEAPPLPKKHDKAAEEALRRQLMAEAVANLPIPLHPGAARFYREEGVLPEK
ncbi:TAXI family TRAP transporter solute-binding subunit [Parvibaculum sp.]|uniref:TAXI family TRAP transporter solute-binding subunit n=1 Tax=Parvibaculum sp. TaxID=2024848 RepID=UPI00320F383D